MQKISCFGVFDVSLSRTFFLLGFAVEATPCSFIFVCNQGDHQMFPDARAVSSCVYVAEQAMQICNLQYGEPCYDKSLSPAAVRPFVFHLFSWPHVTPSKGALMRRILFYQ